MSVLTIFIQKAIVQGICILYGALGEIMTEKSGNLNLGIPGIMYMGGISGLMGAFLYEKDNPDPNAFIGVLISFVCSMQVETFRRVHGHPFASTMCTGNLRSGTEALCQYFKTGDKTLKQKSLRYYGIITFFIIGAVIGGFLTGRAGGSSIFICSILLAIATILMAKEFRI